MGNSLVAGVNTDNQFGSDYFQKSSTYKKFSNTSSAILGLTNYYYGLYNLISKYFPKDIKNVGNVLEIGCGYSGLANRFISSGYKYTGLDISSFIVSELRQKYPGISFIWCDIQQPLNMDSKFDLVVGLEVLEHIENPLIAIKNLYEAMSNSGTIIVSMPNPNSKIPFTDWRKDPTHVSILPKEEWISLFRQSEFTKVTTTTILSLPYLWRFGKIFSRFFSVPNIGASILLVGHK